MITYIRPLVPTKGMKFHIIIQKMRLCITPISSTEKQFELSYYNKKIAQNNLISENFRVQPQRGIFLHCKPEGFM